MVYFLYLNDSDDSDLPDFEFAEAKSVTNLEKHGIDFEQAKRIWLDPGRWEVPAPSGDEPRYAVVGVVDGRHWTAFITYRNERVRIISVRRSRANEKLLRDDHI